MRFVRDEEKNRRNRAKHKVSFESAVLVFDDPNALSLQDRFVAGEERWQTLGLVGGMVILWLRIRFMKKMGKKSSGLFQRARPRLANGGSMSKTRKPSKEIALLAAMDDAKIDTSDIPEVKDWSAAVVGKFYRPIKKPVTVRLDADVVAWLKSQGPGYQTRINKFLRAAMIESRTRRKRA